MVVKKWGPLLALLALTAISVTGLAVQEPQPNSHLQPTKTEKRDSPDAKPVAAAQENNWYGPFFERPTDTLLVVFNGLLALFTWRLYAATNGLFTETAGLRSAAEQQSADMQASIKAAVDAVQNGITANQIAVTVSERQLRAYVTATNIDIVTHRDPGHLSAYLQTVVEGPVNTYRFTAILRNGGQTPAINVVTNFSCRRLRKGDLQGFDFPDSSDFGHGVIGPASEIHTRSIPVVANVFEPVDDTEWFLWGWAEYDDIFDGTSRHRTEFSFEIERTRPPGSAQIWALFKPLDRFNAVDEGCMREFNPAENRYG